MRHFRILMAALGLTAFLAAEFQLTNAQEFETREETALTIEAGTVFEIMSIADSRAPQFSWVLTQHREFVEAARGPVFRIRLTKTGDYSLDAGVFLPEESKGIRKPIKLTVIPPALRSPAYRTGRLGEGGPQVVPTGTGAMQPETTPVPPLVTDPVLRKDTIFLETDLLKIEAGSLVAPFTLDTDGTTDSNGDGDTENDNVSERTFFQDNGTPLHVWFAMPKPERIFVVSSENTEPLRIKIRMGASGGTPEILATVQENGTVSFSVENAPEGMPLLYKWDFGDGGASLLETPKHTYGRNENYATRVEIIDLTTGSVLVEAATSVSVTNIVPAPPPPPAEETPEPSGTSFGWLWTTLRYLIYLLFAVGLGLGGMFLISRFRKGGGGGLQKKLEEIEGSIMKKEPDAKKLVDVPAPMELKRTDKPEKTEAPKEAKKETPKTVPAPEVIQTTEAPAWLKKGLEKGAESEKKVPTAAPPAPAPKPVTPVPPPVSPTPPFEAQKGPQALNGKQEATKPPMPPARSDVSDVPPPVVEPKPVSPPLPTPPPTQPAPVQAPSAPKPVTPLVVQAPTEPKPTPPPPAPAPTPTPAPVDIPKPVEPPPFEAPKGPQALSGKPTPAPAPAPAPKPIAPPVQQKIEPPKPELSLPPATKEELLTAPPKEEALPARKKEEALPAPKDDDEPIAYIRADSIEENHPEPPKA
ncbi:MAG TPA: PKD domain-containing protein [Candidatus Peribacteraceae bacterium]|nr:PKD domain-containing protein [Candidatus Peribacteraceae bacterium]